MHKCTYVVNRTRACVYRTLSCTRSTQIDESDLEENHLRFGDGRPVTTTASIRAHHRVPAREEYTRLLGRCAY